MCYNYTQGMSKLKEYLSQSPLRSASILAILMLFTWYCFFGWKYGFVYNVGNSMLPTFQDKELLVVQRASTLKHWSPRRYDEVIIQTEWYEKLSKRVIALEGEHVKIKHGKIYINDKHKRDPFGRGDIIFYTEPEEDRKLKPKEEWLFLNTNMDVGVVPKDHVYVIGDNREISWHGIVPVKDITDLIIF